MTVAAQIGGLSRPELTIGCLGIVLVCGCGLWVLLQRFLNEPSRPDPWDAETVAELERDTGTPLCHHCLAPHDLSTNFCGQCGAAVGACTNLSPYLYLFSLGHALRIGTGERFKRSPLTIGGFFIVSLAEYGIFAPFYWFRLVKNLPPKAGSTLLDDSGPTPETGGEPIPPVN